MFTIRNLLRLLLSVLIFLVGFIIWGLILSLGMESGSAFYDVAGVISALSLLMLSGLLSYKLFRREGTLPKEPLE